MPSISTEAQKLAPSAMISLFALDATEVGGPVWYFTDTPNGGQPVMFGGIAYQPIGIELRGMGMNGAGELPRPELVLANTSDEIQAIVNTWGNLNNCGLIRIRTYERFLDGKPEADPSAIYGPDIFKIDRKSIDTPEMITWELSAAVDQEGAYVGRTIIRDVCMSRYRSYNGSSGDFDYSRAICPYTGDRYFDANDEEVPSPNLDVPSRRKSCCEARFGKGNPLPFGGFLGVMRAQ